MDVNTNLILMQYFENAADLKPGEFVLLREGKVIDPLIHGKFTKEHISTIRVSDNQEVFEGDVLVYPKTRQYCIIDDIRHYFSEGEGYYLIHYHTQHMFPPPPPHHHRHCCHKHEDEEE
ncbi:MAG: hypothetical protein IJS29_10015 [Selenomonadaceae bacterium]|nr:hypothetical protein [Selenomonadaceae bacterium]